MKKVLEHLANASGIAFIAIIINVFCPADARADFAGFQNLYLNNFSSYTLNLNNDWDEWYECYCGYYGGDQSPIQTIAPGNGQSAWILGVPEGWNFAWGVQYGVVIPGTNNIYSQYCTMTGDTGYYDENISVSYGCADNTPENLLRMTFSSQPDSGMGLFTVNDPPGALPGSIISPAVGPAPSVVPEGVPEPTSFIVLTTGLAGLLLLHRRRRRSAPPSQ